MGPASPLRLRGHSTLGGVPSPLRFGGSAGGGGGGGARSGGGGGASGARMMSVAGCAAGLPRAHPGEQDAALEAQLSARRTPNRWYQLAVLLRRGITKYLRAFWPQRVIDTLLLVCAAVIVGGCLCVRQPPPLSVSPRFSTERCHAACLNPEP
jgi:hypothetical protein